LLPRPINQLQTNFAFGFERATFWDNEARFKKVCEEVSGMDLDWFFQQWLHETKTVDYRLGGVKKMRMANGEWHTEVEIVRKDDGIRPVEVELTLANNEKIRQRWDGKANKGTLTFSTATEPRRAVLDPDDQILDKSRIGHGNLRVEFYPDYPRMNYNPPDA
jgi:hypothetical protein